VSAVVPILWELTRYSNCIFYPGTEKKGLLTFEIALFGRNWVLKGASLTYLDITQPFLVCLN